MTSLSKLTKKQDGFTIVELLIVIVVIGILAALVITQFNGITKKGRDAERQTDVNAVYSQLEFYYANNAKYPTLDQMNNVAPNTTFRGDNFKGLDDAALKDPRGTASTLVAAPSATAYAYVATPAGCDNAATDCTNFTLTATLEGGGTFVKKSNN